MRRLHQPAALRYQCKSIFKGEHAREAGCDVFSDAVPGHGTGLNSPIHPELRQCVLNDEQRGLRHCGLGQIRSGGVRMFGVQNITEIETEMADQLCATFIQTIAKNGFSFVQLGRHADLLRSLTWEQHGYLQRVCGSRAGDHSSLPGPCQQHLAMREFPAPDLEGVSGIRKVGRLFGIEIGR